VELSHRQPDPQRVQQFREPEVRELWGSGGIYQDVLRLDVAVEDPSCMSDGERCQRRFQDELREGVPTGSRVALVAGIVFSPSRDVLQQVLVDPLKRDVVLLPIDIEASRVQTDNVGMIQRLERFALAQERLAKHFVGKRDDVEQLHGYEGAILVVVSRLEDMRSAADPRRVWLEDKSAIDDFDGHGLVASCWVGRGRCSYVSTEKSHGATLPRAHGSWRYSRSTSTRRTYWRALSQGAKSATPFSCLPVRGLSGR
jgi:hypothetical protein